MSKTLANFDDEAKWSGVVNFHCMQMSLVTEHTAFFSAMIEMTRQVHHVFALWQGCNFS